MACVFENKSRGVVKAEGLCFFLGGDFDVPCWNAPNWSHKIVVPTCDLLLYSLYLDCAILDLRSVQ